MVHFCHNVSHIPPNSAAGWRMKGSSGDRLAGSLSWKTIIHGGCGIWIHWFDLSALKHVLAYYKKTYWPRMPIWGIHPLPKYPRQTVILLTIIFSHKIHLACILHFQDLSEMLVLLRFPRLQKKLEVIWMTQATFENCHSLVWSCITSWFAFSVCSELPGRSQSHGLPHEGGVPWSFSKKKQEWTYFQLNRQILPTTWSHSACLTGGRNQTALWQLLISHLVIPKDGPLYLAGFECYTPYQHPSQKVCLRWRSSVQSCSKILAKCAVCQKSTWNRQVRMAIPCHQPA